MYFFGSICSGSDGNKYTERVKFLSLCRYDSYRTVTMETRECIVEKGYALRAVMIDIANNLGVAHTCHNFHKDNVYDYRFASHHS